MKKPRLISILLTTALLAAACGSDTSSSVSDVVDEAALVRIGVRNDNPPLSYVDESGNWVGFDIDLANALADELEVDAELVVVDGTTRISFLQNGTVDMSVASMNHTRDRDEAIDFSITYFWDNQSFLVRSGEYASIDELAGATVAANAGSSAIGSWIDYLADLGLPAPEIVEFSDKLAAMEALRAGAVDGYTEDNITLLALAAGDASLELLPGGHNPVQFGVGVPVDDSRWRDAVNFALQQLWNNGAYHEIYNRWFVDEGRVLDLPLGGAMEIWP